MASFAKLGNDLYTGKRSFDIVGRRKLWYTISAVLILLSLVGLLGRGINFGIEFRGGSEFRVSTVSDTSGYEDTAQEAVAQSAPNSEASVTLIGTDTIRVQTGQLESGPSEEVRADLAEAFGVDAEEVSSSFVGPSWGSTVTTKAIQALVAFLVLVSLVLALYFRTWKMAAAALVALLHDVVFTVGTYALLGIEVSPASMIGFLTILGYSIYDTIVVFDKVRESTDQAMDTRTVDLRTIRQPCRQPDVGALDQHLGGGFAPGGHDRGGGHRLHRPRHPVGPGHRAVHRDHGRHVLLHLHRDTVAGAVAPARRGGRGLGLQGRAQGGPGGNCGGQGRGGSRDHIGRPDS